MPVRVIVETLGARFGGIRTYVENLLAAWADARPEDSLVVLTNSAHQLELSGHVSAALDLRRPEAVTRVLKQSLATPRLVRETGADVVLATHPVTGVLPYGAPLVVVVHDLRHEIQPEQFSRGRRLVRRASYSLAYRTAAATISVSERTRSDLLALHPEVADKPSFVVPHGADHVTNWPGRPLTGPAVAFAHHANKNSHLVIDAWALARARGVDVPELAMLGGAAQAGILTQRAEERGVSDLITVHGWLSEPEFRRSFASARLVVMSSGFEGFGLPVVEAMARGIPVIIGPDPALVEVAGGHAVLMSSWTPAALADAVGRALRLDENGLVEAREHASAFTWRQTALATAEALERVRA